MAWSDAARKASIIARRQRMNKSASISEKQGGGWMTIERDRKHARSLKLLSRTPAGSRGYFMVSPQKTAVFRKQLAHHIKSVRQVLRTRRMQNAYGTGAGF